jgi:hypothetical protein
MLAKFANAFLFLLKSRALDDQTDGKIKYAFE